MHITILEVLLVLCCAFRSIGYRRQPIRTTQQEKLCGRHCRSSKTDDVALADLSQSQLNRSLQTLVPLLLSLRGPMPPSTFRPRLLSSVHIPKRNMQNRAPSTFASIQQKGTTILGKQKPPHILAMANTRGDIEIFGKETPSTLSIESPKNNEKESLERVVDILKTDIPEAFQKDFRWDIFAEDFQVLDQTKIQVASLETSKLLLQLLHKVFRRFRIEDDVKVEFVHPEATRGRELQKSLLVRWHVEISMKPRLRFWRKVTPITIEATTIVQLNDLNKVQSMRMDKFLVDGQDVQIWPDVDLSQKPNKNLKAIESWIREMRNLTESRIDSQQASNPIATHRKPRVPEYILDRVVDRILDRLFARLEDRQDEQVERIFDRLIDQAMDRAPDRILERVLDLPRKAGDVDASNGLRADFPDVLTREPTWSYFANDFKLIDQNGFLVKIGVTVTKLGLYVLRNIHSALSAAPLRDEFKVHMTDKVVEAVDGTLEPVLVAQWTLDFELDDEHESLDMKTVQELRETYLPLIPENYGFPVKVAGTFVFSFNSNREVNALKVDSWSINGNQLKLTDEFPFIQLSKVTDR